MKVFDKMLAKMEFISSALMLLEDTVEKTTSKSCFPMHLLYEKIAKEMLKSLLR